MKISSSFFAGILWTAMLAPSIAAFAQTQNDQAALAKQSSIVFSGTVSRLGATSFAGVPQSPNTIVVRVDSVLKKPPAISLKKGDNVTVELKDRSAFQQGTKATFYTEGWIFGSGVAVKELGHELNPGGGTLASGADAAESALVQAQKQISDQDLQNRIASSELVLSAASRMFTAGLSPSPPPRVITPRNTARTGTKPFSRSTQSSREQNPKKARWSCAFRSPGT